MVNRNLLANYLSSGWSALMSMAFLPLYTKYLGIEAYGLIGIFTAIQGWFALLDMGFSPALNREMSRYKAGLHSMQSINNLMYSMEVIFVAICIFLIILMYGISDSLAHDWLNFNKLEVNAVANALSITGVIIGGRWMTTLYRSALFGLQLQVWLSFENAVFSTIRGVGTLAVLYYVSPTVKAFFTFQAIVFALEAYVLYIKVHSIIKRGATSPSFSLKSLNCVRQFAGGMTLIAILATLMTQFDKLVLSKMLTLEQFGYMTLATTVASTLTALTIPISNVAFPRFSLLISGKKEKLLALEYHKFSQLLTALVVPTAIFISIFSIEILLQWTNQEELSNNTAPILSVWIIGTAFSSIMNLPYTAQIASGWTKLTIVSYAIAVLIIIPAILFFSATYGAVAAAWIWLFVNVGFVVLVVPFMHACILKNEIKNWYLYDLIYPASGALIFIVFLRFVYDYFIIKSTGGTLIFLLIGVGTSILVTAMLTRIGRGNISNGVIQPMLRSLLRWRKFES